MTSSQSNEQSTNESLPILRVAGVPEHFSVPFHIAIERGMFKSAGVDVRWTDVGTGTGTLIAALKAGEQDLVVALTEGLISDIAQGSALRLISSYVATPLTWAIVTGANSAIKDVEDLRNQTIAISRFTSGSHLMSCVLASQRGWRQDELNFAVHGAFEPLRNAINSNQAAAFMWEKQMTKPFIDSGEVRRIGDIVTPWPCFMIASTTAIVDEKREIMEKALTVLREACQIFATDPSIPAHLAEKFNFTVPDAETWLKATSVTASHFVSESAIETTVDALKAAGILKQDLHVDPHSIIDPRLAELSSDIHSMRLYNKPELITALNNQLRVHNLTRGALTYSQLSPYDQNHYEPLIALDEMMRLTGVARDSQAVNIGSNLGGPARYVAGKYDVHVIAIELQQDLNAVASELTERCKLDHLVHHISADAVKLFAMLASESFDLVFSFLTILHLDWKQRNILFKQVHRTLKPAGCMYVADWYAKSPLTENEKTMLKKDIFCRYLPSLDEYKQQLVDAGLVITYCEDVSSRWTSWVEARAARWNEQKNELCKIHGDDLYERLKFFFDQATTLMQGNVGGVLMVVKKA